MVQTGRFRAGVAPARVSAILLPVLLAASCLLVSCAAATPADDGTPEPRAVADPARSWNEALSTQTAPPLLIAGELTQQLGDWPPSDRGDEFKQSLLGGELALTGAEPAPPPPQQIELGGVARSVRVQTASEALKAMAAAGAGSCVDCTPLEVTDPVLIRTEVSTILGPASVPAWSFRVPSTDVRITRVAVDPAEYLRVDGLQNGPLGSNTTAELLSDRRIRVSFFGSPAPVGPCGQDYSGGAQEDGRVVMIRIVSLPNPAPVPTDLACPAIGAMRTVDIDLAAPLADRILITAGGAAVPRS